MNLGEGVPLKVAVSIGCSIKVTVGPLHQIGDGLRAVTGEDTEAVTRLHPGFELEECSSAVGASGLSQPVDVAAPEARRSGRIINTCGPPDCTPFGILPANRF